MVKTSEGKQMGMGLERDVDWHNQRLWKRKKYREQVDKDQRKKRYSDYKHLKQEVDA